MVLSRAQAQSFYDRFGSRQDAQAYYEDAALQTLVAHADFDQAQAVFELGCGTGRFARLLLDEQLPASASYTGTDLSHTMLALARQRIAPHAARAAVQHSAEDMQFPLAAASVDRVVSTYVLDLLSEDDIRQAIAEAHRVLAPGGKLCLVSLTQGVSFPAKIVSALWWAAFRIKASLVGGCRPISLASYLQQDSWSLTYQTVVTRFGIASEVLVATRK